MKKFVQKDENYYSLSNLGEQILQSIENAPGSILRDTIRYGIDLIVLYSFMSGVLLGIGSGLLTRFFLESSITLEFNFVLLMMALPAIFSGTALLIQNNRLILFFGRESKKLPEGLINVLGILGGAMAFFLQMWLLFISVLVVLAPVSLIRHRANFEYVKIFLRPLYSPRQTK
jgi:hypothetical protein